MKVTLRRIKQPNTITNFDGNTIIPYFLDCLSIEWTPEGLDILVLSDHQTMKKTYGQREKLFIFGDPGSENNTINRFQEVSKVLLKEIERYTKDNTILQ